MKVLMLNGSPKANGNTAIALKEMERVFAEEGIEVVTVQVGNQPVRGCIYIITQRIHILWLIKCLIVYLQLPRLRQAIQNSKHYRWYQ